MNRLATLADHEPRNRALSKVDAGLVIFREAAPHDGYGEMGTITPSYLGRTGRLPRSLVWIPYIPATPTSWRVDNAADMFGLYGNIIPAILE